MSRIKPKRTTHTTDLFSYLSAPPSESHGPGCPVVLYVPEHGALGFAEADGERWYPGTRAGLFGQARLPAPVLRCLCCGDDATVGWWRPQGAAPGKVNGPALLCAACVKTAPALAADIDRFTAPRHHATLAAL